ncbi:U32 family peptidase [Marinobacter sp. M3C]|jgi:putative protease|uniref:ubiquinone anaerobic biosynthesis protein UbiU n=1 Tax=unclassified Marinobacter TaxID=83889 RepID=UPI00200D0B85|nr:MULTISPECIES: peptidase U32 family protein [unclassified Marinobacter]UQG55221.1 U32 family peptidase [Marinobacter sp. M4C]UQG59484.1 U32 family peptidase [Marinobacter sp. M3C]UQG64024.1 U32 family peptidase [Marinobacter sp. M2C]UQG68307.1 U32 family peptidase [Marinobacter sp. M1C]
MELVCPAGSLPALKAAVDNGANAVYLGFKDSTNARQFKGLNFNDKRASEGIEYAHKKGARVFCAINTFPQPQGWKTWTAAVDRAATLGIDAMILADMGLLDYAASRYPQIDRHLSVQGSATSYEALRFYKDNFGIRRAVLPRVLSLDQIRGLAKHSPVELEVFAFGSLCIMAEGRCYLSSYITDESPNTRGACSPAKAVRWQETPQGLESRLNGILIDRYGKGESAGYPTLCKGRFEVEGSVYHAIEEPVSLNTIDLLPQLQELGISAVKIEGRQRSPAYIADVASTWRQALDRLENSAAEFVVDPAWNATLAGLSEGGLTTIGAYHRKWK